MMNLRRKLTILVIITGLGFIFVQNCFAYKEPTHFTMNRLILKTENPTIGFSLDEFLKEYLGFEMGIRTGIYNSDIELYKDDDEALEEISSEIWRWIATGGSLEDEPYPSEYPSRSMQHFHNPLKTWDKAGLECLLGEYDSLILWSQAVSQCSITGEYSWPSVRGYYYNALISDNDNERNEYFAKTFRGLGQLMHLVQDSSVPAHVRNDVHLFNDTIETFVEDYRVIKDIDGKYIINEVFSGWVNDVKDIGYHYDKSILTFTPNQLAPIPIAMLVDTDCYDGTNPEDTVNGPIGLAEYTNANFFSEDTIFSSEFPYPTHSSTTAEPIPDPRNPVNTVYRYYYKTGDGDSGYLLAAVPYTSIITNISIAKPCLDDFVYQDYADRLIPRAAAYSNGLLEYFFRGKIEIQIPDEGAYALITSEPDDPQINGFNHIKLKAKNVSDDNEEMVNGDIQLVIKYRLSEETPFIETVDEISDTSDSFYYIIASESNDVKTIPRDDFVGLDFQLPSDIPLWATDVYFYVVFRGDLGGNGHYLEENNAVCVGFKDVSEPTPMAIINGQDHICLNSSLYIAGSEAAVAVVDTDENGIADEWEWDVYPHTLINIFLRFCPNDNPQYPYKVASEYNPHISKIEKGHYVRLYSLTDYIFTYSCSDFPTINTDPDDYIEPADYSQQMFQYNEALINQYVHPDEETCTSGGMSYPCEMRAMQLLPKHRGLLSQVGINFTYSDYPEGYEGDCIWDNALPDIELQTSGFSLFNLLSGIGSRNETTQYKSNRKLFKINNEITMIKEGNESHYVITKNQVNQFSRKEASLRKKEY